jgi:DnaJ family protein C protein 2
MTNPSPENHDSTTAKQEAPSACAHLSSTLHHHNKPTNLFDYTSDELKQFTHYEILNVEPYIHTDGIKKAYRKASLKYHPDKTGREDDDYVFLAVKAAYDVLSDPVTRQAYDSTAIPFDDSIPPNRNTLLQDPLVLYQDEDFYETFGPVFRRNLRFDARLRPDRRSNSNGKNANKASKIKHTPPDFGDASTPLEQVHRFYEYWVHFESWRDFSMQAADELELEQTLENAESRYEKRFYQKEIDKRAKQLKKIEMNRIQTLVERAMEADPRLRKERADALAAKERAQQERILQKQRQIEAQQQAEREKQIQAELYQQELAQQKAQREQEKKILRSQRQLLRRMTSASFDECIVNSNMNHSNHAKKDNNAENESNTTTTTKLTTSCCYEDAYDMNQDVEFLCQNLDLEQLSHWNKLMQEQQQQQNTSSSGILASIQQKVKELKLELQQQSTESSLTRGNNTSSSTGNENSAASRSSTTTTTPWTKEQLSALAKAVKKYPPGTGAARWDQICQFVNHLCKNGNDTPRTKEECIEKYNQVARKSTAGAPSVPSASTTATTTTAANQTGTTSDAAPTSEDSTASWSAEQDQQLQEALSKYPAAMEKNERWTAIAKAVQGKSKKECVQRFKAIREAIKAKEK